MWAGLPKPKPAVGRKWYRESGLVLILGGVGKLLLACSCLRLGISSVSLVGAQYLGV